MSTTCFAHKIRTRSFSFFYVITHEDGNMIVNSFDDDDASERQWIINHMKSR